jgi:hypothetical protein
VIITYTNPGQNKAFKIGTTLLIFTFFKIDRSVNSFEIKVKYKVVETNLTS